MHSQPSLTRCGGTGAIIPLVPAGDGHVLITVGADIMAAGMVAAIGVVTGGIIIIIPGIIRVGVAEVTTGLTVHIQTGVHMVRQEEALLYAVQTVYARKVYVEAAL